MSFANNFESNCIYLIERKIWISWWSWLTQWPLIWDRGLILISNLEHLNQSLKYKYRIVNVIKIGVCVEHLYRLIIISRKTFDKKFFVDSNILRRKVNIDNIIFGICVCIIYCVFPNGDICHKGKGSRKSEYTMSHVVRGSGIYYQHKCVDFVMVYVVRRIASLDNSKHVQIYTGDS